MSNYLCNLLHAHTYLQISTDWSSSTFRLQSGRVIRDLFRLLNVVRHCTEALVYADINNAALYMITLPISHVNTVCTAVNE